MNKRGQVTIVFITLLPILLMLLGIIIDMGYNYTEKRRVDNVIKDTITYGFEHILDEQPVLKDNMHNLMNKNISNIKSEEIIVEDNYIKITINKETEGLFGRILNKRLYQVNSSYYGYMENDKLKLIKE
jgi:hypothetical protein